MLFHSREFILIFLPLTLVVFYKLGNIGYHRIAMSWLVGASLFYYGWWNPSYVGLILGSILFNYAMGIALSNDNKKLHRKLLLIIGIASNLGLLGYFKYTNFFVENLNNITSSTYHLKTIILPLAISFFTFQQITYIIDAYHGNTREYNFLHYCLFVSFFPQLIAGPIVHHREMMPQFSKKSIYKFHHEHLAVGLTIFILGLFKKVILADKVAIYATPVFKVAEQGATLTFFEAWGGALAYSYQLYFDFSGYSDMAIGIARMFGIRLPQNFHSPYKASNIIDFWRRWHITLSRFLKEYLYIPLGGNRKGIIRRYVNVMITMILGGLWHGAGWTFIAWGALHGFYLVINHVWQKLSQILHLDSNRHSQSRIGLSTLFTFLLVVVGWVFFRAESLNGAINVIEGMIGLNGAVLDYRFASPLRWLDGIIDFKGKHAGAFNLWGFPWIIFLGIIVWLMPNTQEIMNNYKPVFLWNMRNVSNLSRLNKFLMWEPRLRWAMFILVIAVVSYFNISKISEFLYYQF